MIDGRIEFPYIQLQAILGPGLIPQGPFNGIRGAMDPASLYAGVSVRREKAHENRLQDVHCRVMGNTIRKVRKSEDLPLLWLIDREGGIGRGPVRPVAEHHMERRNILLPVPIVEPYPVLTALTLTGFHIGQPQVVRVYDLVVNVTYPFHRPLLLKGRCRTCSATGAPC